MPAAAPSLVEEPLYMRQDDGLDLRELLDILIRGKWLILAAVLLVLVPVTVWTFLQPQQYSAYALMLVEKQDNDLQSVLPSSPSAAFFRDERNLSNELLVLRQSMPLAQAAARRLLTFRTVPGTGEALTILAPVPTAEGERAPTEQDVAFRLQSLYVSPAQEGQDADALRVSAVSTSAAEAALIANVYADAFVDLSQQSSRAGVSASRDFLEQQVADRSDELLALDGAVRQFMQREQAVALDQETSRLIDQIASLEAQRDAAAVEIQMKAAGVTALRAELNRIEPGLADRVASTADGQIEAAQLRIRELEAELEPFYRQNPQFRDGADVPDAVSTRRSEIERLQRRIRTLSEQLTRESIAAGGGGPGDTQSGFRRVAELQRQLTDAQIELDGQRAKQGALQNQIASMEGELSQIPGQSIELAQLQRQRLGAERTYSALDEKLQEARVAEQSKLGYATVIRPAFPSPAPFAPNRKLNLMVGLLLGLGLGVAAAIAKVRLDHRFHRPDDLKTLDIPLIGTVPDTTDLLKKEFGNQKTIDVGGRQVDTHLVALLNPMATASETYRALRTSVQFSRPDVVIKTILVTSSNPGEGKSITAANLAAVFAQSGRSVLLIDADLRRPTVHSKFGLSREPGLVQQLFTETAFDASLATEVADDLWVMAAGALAPNPSELLGSKRMRDLLTAIQERFDIVILDAPPVLAATDAVLLSTQADATLVVVRAGETRDYDLRSSLDALQGVGAKVIGTVFNGFDVSKAYGYRYKYAYRYGQDYAYGHDASTV
jgi:tyrosine-protein kinase Etk/Wzc